MDALKGSLRLVACLSCSAILLLACSRIGSNAAAPSPTQPLSQSVGTANGSTGPGDTSGPPTAAPEGATARLPTPQTSLVTFTPTATPALQARQLTKDSCCVQPFWSPDSGAVLFIDRPDQNSPSGLWKVDIGGGPEQFVTDKLGVYTRDMQLRAYPQNGKTIVERLSDGQTWTIPNDGRAVSFSPGGARVAWTTGQSGPPFDTARREIWISRFDGTQAYPAHAVTGGGFSGWLSDDRFLVSGRLEEGSEAQIYWVVHLPAEGAAASPTPVEVARAKNLRSPVISPGGGWIAYLVTFSGDPAQDGLWLVDTSGNGRRKLELFGAYRWRDEGRLLVVPQEAGAQSNRIVQFDVRTGASTPLTDPSALPFKISGGDWSISPDGKYVVLVSAGDYNLWLVELP